MDIIAWVLVINGKVVSLELTEPRWEVSRGEWVKVEIKQVKEIL